MRVARAQKVIGVPVAAKEMASVFQAPGLCTFKKKATPSSSRRPRYRFDIEIEEDLIEEVARLYGFERIAAHPPRVAGAHAAGAGAAGARCTRCASAWPRATTAR